MSDLSPSQRELDLLLIVINNGFEGVHARLDKLNGKVDNHTASISTLEERTKTMNGRANTGLLSGLGALITYLGAYLWNKWTN
jgi:tetrahydromethanopterin S-methyltransferase subunit G